MKVNITFYKEGLKTFYCTSITANRDFYYLLRYKKIYKSFKRDDIYLISMYDIDYVDLDLEED